MTQYAVVVRPDFTQTVRVMGPYRSRAVAIKVMERFDAIDGGEREAAIAPQVLVLEAWPDVLPDLTDDSDDEIGSHDAR